VPAGGQGSRPQHRFSEASYYLWRSKFERMDLSGAKRRKALDSENARVKKASGGVDA
jgi:hypothetical protein